MPKGSLEWRLMMLGVACLQNFCMGGVILGWAAISNTMLVSKDGAPGLQPNHIHDIFVIASSANMCSPLFLGLILDRFGPRACSVVSIFISCFGFALFGLAESLTPGKLGLGDGADMWITMDGIITMSAVCIGFGGPGVQNAVIHISNLFPAKKGLVTAIITGCFQLSFIVFFIFDQIWFFGGVDYRTIFLCHAAICGICLIFSVILWPDKPFQFDEEVMSASPTTRKALGPAAAAYAQANSSPLQLSSNISDGISNYGAEWGAVTTGPSIQSMGLVRYPSVFQRPPNDAGATPAGGEFGVAKSGGAASKKLKDEPLKVQFFSQEFLSATVLLTVASFWANFYIGAVDLQLADEAFMSPHDQAAAMRWFTIITVCGVCGIPFVGYAIDHMGFRATLAITITIGVAWAACTLVRSRWVLLLSFVLYSLFRTFTFNYYFAFLADRLGFRYFGVLAGASFCIAGVVGLCLQAPFLAWGHAACSLGERKGGVGTMVKGAECGYGNWRLLNCAKIFTIALLYIIPLKKNLFKMASAIVRSLSSNKRSLAELAIEENNEGYGSRGVTSLPAKSGSLNLSYELVGNQRSLQLGV